MSEGARATRTVLVLSGVTLFGLGGLGAWLITAVQGRALRQVLGLHSPPLPSLAAGVALGLVPGLAALALLRRPFLRPVAGRYAALIGPFIPQRWHHVLLSACAGIGEELLFRGAVQHWAGVPLTAVAFVALHGYLDPRDARLSLYGAFLTACMMAYGAMADALGLWPVMLAHAVFDLLLMDRLRRWR